MEINFLAIWAAVLKKKFGPIKSNFWGQFFHVFIGKKMCNFFWKLCRSALKFWNFYLNFFRPTAGFESRGYDKSDAELSVLSHLCLLLLSWHQKITKWQLFLFQMIKFSPLNDIIFHSILTLNEISCHLKTF